MNNMSTALWITLLGMGLVFGAIIVLWLMMILLTTITTDKATASQPNPEPVPALPQSPPAIGGAQGGKKAQAAAIAVAMALAEQEICAAHPLPTPPTAIVSAWQLGMRTRLLAQKGNFRRR
jgi:Na+-transporting methylmalonyl-CoA/oxaloacetate decarboxylase gamma subunit